jgi:hypothetical protein
VFLQKVLFISDDLEIECERKKYKCGSNFFWNW